MLANWARATTTTTGTGNLTLSGVSGFPTPNDVYATNLWFYYSILDDSTGAPLECGIGYLSASTTLVRQKVLATFASSVYDDTSPSAVSLASGTKLVVLSPLQHSLDVNIPWVDTAVGTNNKAINNGAIAVGLSGSNGYQFNGADRIECFPWKHTYGGEVNSFKIHVSTSDSGKIARVGLYEINTNGTPGDLIVEGSSTFDLSSNGMKTSTFTARVIPPGWYFIAILSDTGTAQIVGSGSNTASSVFIHGTAWGMTDSNPGVAAWKASVTGVATGMPNPYPSSLNITGNLKVPQIMMGVV